MESLPCTQHFTATEQTMQNPASLALDHATRHDSKPAPVAAPLQAPIELELHQLKAVSGGDGSISTPVKGW